MEHATSKPERMASKHRIDRWPTRPDALAISMGHQHPEIVIAGNLHGPHARHVVGNELDIENRDADGSQMRDQPDETDLRGVSAAAGRIGEHRFPHEDPTDMHTVEPSDEHAVPPGLHAVGQPLFPESTVRLYELFIDPGLLPTGPRIRTGSHDLPEGRIACDPKTPGADPPCETPANSKIVQRQNAAGIWIEPLKLTRFGMSHREVALRVGRQQNVWFQLGHCRYDTLSFNAGPAG